MDKRCKHGDCKKGEKSKLYRMWDNMMTRCYRRSYTGYHRYGGRGITVCDEWRTFAGFKQWALKNGYREDLQIDRRDVNCSYCPENCRFVTPKRQARNKRNTVYIEFGGVRATLIDFCDLFLVPYKTAHRRLKKGWPIVRVLSSVPLPSPKQPKGRTA